MKKFTLALATLALSVASMNATYYVTGALNGWSLSNNPFEETSTPGVYKAQVKANATGAFLITQDGSYDKKLGAAGAPEVRKDTPVSVSLGGKDLNLVDQIKDPVFTLDTNNMTLTVTGGEAQITEAYCLHGNIAQGASGWEDLDLTEENGKWVSQLSVKAGEFGIKKIDADNPSQQLAWLSSGDGGKVELNTPLTVSTSGVNWKSSLAGDYTFTFDPDAMTLIIASASLWNDITADENATFAIYTIEGNIVKASANAADVENLENGMYIINGEKVMICK